MPRQGARELVRRKQAPLDDLQPWVVARHFARRADERGDVVAAREREIENVRTNVPGGTEDQESKSHALKTGQASET